MEARGGIELEPICGRERSGSPQAKSRATQRGTSLPASGESSNGGAGRNRTADRGFADLGLTTWRPRRLSASASSKPTLTAARADEKPSPDVRKRQVYGAGDGI